jgi:prepilin-type N-terminal cleavage/methylation domain-containing protein
MNREFTAKLLRHLSNKKNKKNKGFTLIELLVVVIIIGVLAAVALPNLLAQVGKARESEGKNAMGTINRSEQAFHFENKAFSGTINNGTAPGDLGANNPLGVIVTSRYYTLTANATNPASTTTADSTAVSTDATGNGTRDYSAAIEFISASSSYESVLCQGTTVGVPTGAVVTTGGTAAPTCAAGTSVALQ